MVKNCTDIKYIAYYLPQFHCIPENDKTWGKGFTEWVNVKSAYPLFEGHKQPVIPHEDIGYYHLNDTKIMQKQAKMAKDHGIDGFCYYYYWFNGKTLLEKPLKNMLSDKDVDIPFCLCWANHNWTKNWDGGNTEIIIEQTYDENTFTKFIDDLIPYFRDERYIKINNKHLLIIYQPAFLPNAKACADVWKKYAKQKYGIDLYLMFFQHTNFAEPKEFGFDAALENAPNIRAHEAICKINKKIKDAPNTVCIDYLTNVFQYIFRPKPDYTLYSCVYPKWDNTARMKKKGTIVYMNSSPENFKKFLVEMTKKTLKETSNHFLFINAWNEWAEGAYLEPDKDSGYTYLEIVKQVKKMTYEELSKNGFKENLKQKYLKKIKKAENKIINFYLFHFIKIPWISAEIKNKKIKFYFLNIPILKLTNVPFKRV